MFIGLGSCEPSLPTVRTGGFTRFARKCDFFALHIPTFYRLLRAEFTADSDRRLYALRAETRFFYAAYSDVLPALASRVYRRFVPAALRASRGNAISLRCVFRRFTGSCEPSLPTIRIGGFTRFARKRGAEPAYRLTIPTNAVQ